jgi:endonuclease/exonuclease/phosphatase family metal-dependent hydrolase
MTRNYTKWTIACLVASLPLVYLVLTRPMPLPPIPVVRVASFNAALNRPEPGQLLAELRAGSESARHIAEIIQRCEVDVLLLCELDRDDAAESAKVFATDYLAKSQNGQRGIEFTFSYVGEVNTGEPSGMDLDGDGATNGPGDAFGFGRWQGQYGMAILSRHPIARERVRTFRTLAWSAMPAAMRPEGFYDDATWQQLRLSSKSHWDVPVRVLGQDVHLLCSHPTPPVFDGKEDRNGCRNHDEIRFWVDYLTPGKDAWIKDDAGVQGGLAEGAQFVVLGDLNCDPVDGDSRREALLQLLAHPRVQDPLPASEGGAQSSLDQWAGNALHKGAAERDTGDFADDGDSAPGNLRVDYVLPARSMTVVDAGVYWPAKSRDGHQPIGASDHRLVFVDLGFAAPK